MLTTQNNLQTPFCLAAVFFNFYSMVLAEKKTGALRKRLISWLFDVSNQVYTSIYKRKQPWNITKRDLLGYSDGSLGYALGRFLEQNNFELIPKVERHDCYHVLTGYSTKVEDEIALQYLCLGNGKRSPYLLGAVLLGTLILPDYFSYYVASYKRGKDANPFHDLAFKSLLAREIKELQSETFRIKASSISVASEHTN